MEAFDYSAAMAELEQIAVRVEDPATGLDDIAPLLKRAQTLTEACRAYLRSVREGTDELQA